MNRRAVAALGWLALAARAVAADGATAPAPEPSPAPADRAPVATGSGVAPVAGLRAYADPATGRLRPPTDEEARAAESSIGLHLDRRLMWEEPLPDGTVLVHTEGQLMATSIATVEADGKVVEHCETEPSAAPSTGPSR